MANAHDLEAEARRRDEEMGALTKANKIIIEAIGGTTSFLQLANKISIFVRELARK